MSVPSNIAEGYQRKSDGYIKNFLNMARGSNAELETQLLLCIRLGYISKTEAQKALQLTEELSKGKVSLATDEVSTNSYKL